MWLHMAELSVSVSEMLGLAAASTGAVAYTPQHSQNVLRFLTHAHAHNGTIGHIYCNGPPKYKDQVEQLDVGNRKPCVGNY